MEDNLLQRNCQNQLSHPGLSDIEQELDNDKLEQVPNDLSSLKSKVDESDITKLKTTPVDLSKLKGVVNNNVLKETKYDGLVKKINVNDISRLIKKRDYNTKIKDIEDEIPTTTALNAKMSEFKDEITSITGLATTTALNDLKNDIPDVSTLTKKTLVKKVSMTLTEKKLKRNLIVIIVISAQELNNLRAKEFSSKINTSKFSN